jgi:hypothetical protein
MCMRKQLQRYNPATCLNQSFGLLNAGELKTLLYSVPIESEETIHQHTYYSCQTFSNSSEIFERVREFVIRRVHVCIESGTGHFLHLWWIATW